MVSQVLGKSGRRAAGRSFGPALLLSRRWQNMWQDRDPGRSSFPETPAHRPQHCCMVAAYLPVRDPRKGRFMSPQRHNSCSSLLFPAALLNTWSGAHCVSAGGGTNPSQMGVLSPWLGGCPNPALCRTNSLQIISQAGLSLLPWGLEGTRGKPLSVTTEQQVTGTGHREGRRRRWAPQPGTETLQAESPSQARELRDLDSGTLFQEGHLGKMRPK